MTEQIKLDYNNFQSFISTLKSSASGIDGGIQASRTFEKTNIKPLVKDLEQVIRAIELLNKYQTSLRADIETLEQIGEKIHERDLELADASNKKAANTFELRR